MSKTKATVKGAQESLDKLLSQVDPGLSDSPGQMTNRPTFVPENKPLTLSPEQAFIGGGIASATLSNSHISSKDPNHAKEMAAMQQALSHSDSIGTLPTMIGYGTSAIPMPPDVRDIPNRLYLMPDPYGRLQEIRANVERNRKADRILKALCGTELAPRAFALCGRMGFHGKEFVGLSQALWRRLTIEGIEETEIVSDGGAAEELDGVTTEILNVCFDGFTVRNLTQLARRSGSSLQTTVRQVITILCNEYKVNVATQQETDAANAAIASTRATL